MCMYGDRHFFIRISGLPELDIKKMSVSVLAPVAPVPSVLPLPIPNTQFPVSFVGRIEAGFVV